MYGLPERKGDIMDRDTDYIKAREKTKFIITIGFFFGVVILIVLLISLVAWFLYEVFGSGETYLMVSESPNNINKIEFFEKEDALRPARSFLHIYYHDEIIPEHQMPDEISVEWENDYEAYVFLINQGKDPDIIHIEFE